MQQSSAFPAWQALWQPCRAITASSKEASGQPEQLQGAVLEEEDRSMSRESDDSVLERCVEEQGLMEIEGEWRANDVVCGACDDGGALTAGHLHVH